MKILFFSLLLLSVSCPAQDYLWGVTRFGGSSNAGTLYRVIPDEQTVDKIRDFEVDAVRPFGELTRISDQELIGMTSSGGSKNKGVIFKIKIDGTGFVVLHNFTGANGAGPMGRPLLAIDGKLYGMTKDGGTNNRGVIFRINTDGSGFNKLFDFSDSQGAFPIGSLVEDANGDLYGLADKGGPGQQGVLFKIKPDGTGYTVVHPFAINDLIFFWSSPTIGNDGFIYGVGMYGGVGFSGGIFKVRKDGTEYSVIHSFTAGNPGGQLVFASNGKLYGFSGNSIFSINSDGTGYTPMAVGGFSLTTGGFVQDMDKNLFGVSTGNGSIFKMSEDGSSYTVLRTLARTQWTDGFYPFGQLHLHSDGRLYGMTTAGGTANGGVIYTLGRDGSDYKVLHHFNSSGKEFAPGRTLVRSKVSRHIYGFTSNGGAKGCGIIFRATLDGSEYARLYDFDPATGCTPTTLMEDREGNLWGTVASIGNNSNGGVFKVKPNGSDYLKVAEFNAEIGFDVRANLVQATDNDLYGSTTANVSNNGGSMFKIKTSSNELVKLYTFERYTEPGGASPHTELVQLSDGYFYGTTYTGGATSSGVFFKVKPDGSSYSKLYDFVDQSGSGPIGNLYLNADGFFYGFSSEGGTDAFGVMYKIKPDGSGYQKLYDFKRWPTLYGSLTPDSAKNVFYGTQRAAFGDFGSLFSINADGSSYKQFLVFNGEDGAEPEGNLLLVRSPVTATTSEVASPVQVFPNPVRGDKLLLRSQTSVTAIQAIDLRGRPLAISMAETQQGAELDVSSWANGLYLFRIGLADHRKIVVKVAILR